MSIRNHKPIILLYPPPSDLTQPYSSLPTLTGYLRGEGFLVVQKDISIEIMDDLISPNELLKARNRAINREKKSKLPYDEEYLQRYYKIIGISDYVISHIDEAKQIMRDKALFYNIERYQWAVKLFHSACNLASLAYHPTILQPSQYETELSPTLEGLLDVTSRNKQNLFYDIFKNKIIPQLLKEDPLLIGISVTYDFQIVPAFTLSRLIKSAAPEVHVCIGGAIIQRMEETLLNDPTCFQFADSFCVGEGETALSTLAEYLLSGKTIKKIPNLITKNDDPSDLPNLRHYEDIHKLPCPDFDGLPLPQYFSPEPVLLIQTTRGCYYGKCAFCNVSMNTRRFYRKMENKRLVDNIIKLHQKYNAKRFFFCDDAVPPAHMLSVAKLIKDKLPGVTWGGEARLEKVLTYEFLSLMKEGGCRHLIFGLESASQRILNLMNKGNSVQTDNEILNNCARNGIYVNLQTFIGFPTETSEEAWTTINYLIENERKISTFGFGCFDLEKDTPIYRYPLKFGVRNILKSSNPTVLASFDYIPTTGMTMEDAKKEHSAALKILSAIYSRRSTFIGGASGSHGLLQLSHFDYDEIYRLWKTMDTIKNPSPTDISTSLLFISQELIFSHPPAEMDTFDHLALNTRTGRKFVLSPAEYKLLELCNGKLNASEIVSLWANQQDIELDKQVLLMARGLAMITEFLKKGIIQAMKP